MATSPKPPTPPPETDPQLARQLVGMLYLDQEVEAWTPVAGYGDNPQLAISVLKDGHMLPTTRAPLSDRAAIKAALAAAAKKGGSVYFDVCPQTPLAEGETRGRGNKSCHVAWPALVLDVDDSPGAHKAESKAAEGRANDLGAAHVSGTDRTPFIERPNADRPPNARRVGL